MGKTGVFGVLANGHGPVVWFGADMDSNAVRVATGLPDASIAKQRLADRNEVDVMHACVHDAHVRRGCFGLAKAVVALKADSAFFETRLRTECSHRATAGRRDLERAGAQGGLHVDKWVHGAD